MEAFCEGDRCKVLFHLYCTLHPALSPGTLPPHSQHVMKLIQALQHRGLVLALSSLPSVWDTVMDTLVRAEVRAVPRLCPWGLLGNPSQVGCRI